MKKTRQPQIGTTRLSLNNYTIVLQRQYSTGSYGTGNNSYHCKIMIHDFMYPYQYSKLIVKGWNSTAIGVYYCGYLTLEKKLALLYIGKGAGEGGIRSRLLDHLSEDHWPDITHFGYHVCDTADEAEAYEANEIAKYKPKYNIQGK